MLKISFDNLSVSFHKTPFEFEYVKSFANNPKETNKRPLSEIAFLDTENTESEGNQQQDDTFNPTPNEQRNEGISAIAKYNQVQQDDELNASDHSNHEKQEGQNAGTDMVRCVTIISKCSSFNYFIKHVILCHCGTRWSLHGVNINRRILRDNIWKNSLRNLLLDLTNNLFDNREFTQCSMSGKKGRNCEASKPKLDINRRQAIIGE